MNPRTLLAGVLLLVGLTGGAYWQGRQDGGNACIAEQARDVEVAVIAGEAAASATAAAISKIEVRNVTITQQLQREVIERQVFRDCRSGDDARRLFNSAIPGAAEQPAAAPGELPASHAAR